ncbi:MAG TPA: hypothetical protein VLV15_15135, partial [Dongiaceae bacterium]|nr:hypothetical protein [Dongiaceae bacterium]
ADGLHGSGDPRGELINLQARGDRVMAEVCVQRNARTLLGPLANLQRDLLLDWELGFIRRATLTLTGVPDTDVLREPRLTTLSRQLLTLESSLLLEELTFIVAPTARVLQGVPGAVWNVGLYAPRSLTRLAVLAKSAAVAPRRRGRYFGEPPPARFGWEQPDAARIVTQLPLKGRRVKVETDWTWVHDVMRDVFKAV